MGRKPRLKKENEEDLLHEFGEFLVFKNGISVFICTFCNENSETMELFTTHIKQKHDDKLLLHEEPESIKATPQKRAVRKKAPKHFDLEEDSSSDEILVAKITLPPEFDKLNRIEPKSEQIDFKPDINLNEFIIPPKEHDLIEKKESDVKVEVKIECDDGEHHDDDVDIDHEEEYKDDSGDDEDFNSFNNDNDGFSAYSDNYDNMLEVQISEKLQADRKDKKMTNEDEKLELKEELSSDSQSDRNIASSSKDLVSTEGLDDNSYEYKNVKEISKKKSGWIREKNEFGEWVCQLCGNTYKKGSSLSRHRVLCLKRGGVSIPRRGGINRTKNSKGMYACNHCGKEFDSTISLGTHEKTHKDEKLKEAKQCEICGKHLHSNSSLREHLLRHTGETPYKCSQCPRGFYNKYTLQTHEKIHLPEKQYPCDQCDKKFSRPPDLRRHVRYVHLNERPAPVMCDLCGKSFTFQFNLKYHMRRHLNVKPVSCDLCDMTFVEKGDLNKHKITHNPDFKPFQCEICSVSFSRKITLTKHQKLHTGLKEYVCKICGKAFAQSPGLYMHMKSHGFNKKPEGAGYYERQSHLMYRNMSSRDTD